MMRYISTTDNQLPQFYAVPTFLWEEPFVDLALEAKMLYGMLLSRAGLSRTNGWIDKHGRIYIYFTLEETMKSLRCGEQKASRLMKSLEAHGLIVRERRGCGKPYSVFPCTVEIADDTGEM